jgi:hypothetical protein
MSCVLLVLATLGALDKQMTRRAGLDLIRAGWDAVQIGPRAGEVSFISVHGVCPSLRNSSLIRLLLSDSLATISSI